MRLLIATVLGCLALAAPASARYLHLSEGRVAAKQYAQIEADATTYSYGVGSCWRAGPHIVQCSMTVDARYSGRGKTVVVIALRGDRLYGHLLGERPHFITKLK